MIHVMNFKGEIVDFISQSDSAVIQAVHKRDINERMETFDFTILSECTTHMQERNRIIIQDKNEQYREFIIDRISADIDGYTEVETVASYLEDITKARPYAPGKLEKMTTKQALSDVLKDTGWEVSDATEYGGLRTTSWTSYQTRYDVLLQLCTTYDMMADFYIEVGSNRVDKRLVVLRKRNPLFKGKEITYGKDLTGLKRTVGFSEIKTALLCVGPEPDEGKKRVELVVKDDESQAKYGLPGRYNWGIYEPETEDQNMTEKRLRTLGTTELNKRKSEVISYEVTAIDIEKEYKHEIVNLGDMVRIKNRDFTPPLYVEAEVISEEYDLISKDVTYGFGTYKEFKESDLRSSFDRKLDAIRQKVNDNFSNVNTIVRESLEGELQYFERKILKGDTPPETPVNDLLWLDTSNPKVAVLRRYWNGEWIKSSAENAKDVGAVTREQALYNDLSNTFVNLNVQHSRLMHDASVALESEYLVDTDIKAEVNSKLNDTIGVFNEIKQSLDGMNEETATIGKLVDTQALFLQYREKMQALYNTIENAKIAIDERFKLLQSQYTDEKYNEAMEKIASALPGGNWNAETGQLTGNIPNEERLNELEIGLQETFTSQIKGANQILKNQVDAELLQLKDEITLSVRSVNEKIDGLGDGVNLLDSYNSSRPVSINKDIVSTKSFQGNYYATNLYTADYLKTILIPGETYTYSYEMEIIGLSEKEVPYTKKHGIVFYSTSVAEDRIMSYQDVERKVGNKIKYTRTFVAPEITDHRFVAYAGFYSDDGTLKYPISSNLVEITNFKLERGTKATPYTESLNDRLEPIKIRTTEAENNIKVLQDSLLLTATKTDVQRTLDEQLKPLKNEVNEQKAQLQIMSDSIDSKVSQSDYTTDKDGIVERLNSADTQRQQLSNQISDRVTISEYQSGIEDTKQQINSKIDSISIGGENILNGTKNFTAPFLTSRIEKYGLRTNGELISLDYDSENNRIAWNTRQLNIDVLPNTDYTLSYDAKTHDGIEQGVAYTPIIRLQDDGSQFNPSKYIATGDTYKNTTNEFKRYFFTFNTGETKKINVYFTSKNVGSLVQIKKVKLEQGNKATPYSESQNDINERIAKAQSDAEMSAKAYSDAQDALRKTEVQAYADGIVSAEEQRAIQDAEIKLQQAKEDAKAKADSAENLAKQHANTVSTNAETKAKAYADGKVRQVNQTLTTHGTLLTQNGKDIALRATQEELNASKKILSRVITDLSINTTTGLQLRYDENGSIQSHIVGPDGIKLKGDRVDITVNKDFNVLVNDVANKADETNIINKLNLSREGLDINVNNIGIRGGGSVNYLEIKNNSVLSSGVFTRTWANVTDSANLTLGIRNGYILVSNEETGYNLYMTEKGLSTMMNAASGETAGTLEFHYQGYNENSRGVRLHSTYGAVALESDYSRVYTVANLTNNIESRQYGVYIRPFKDSRAGLNEFQFYVKDNDSSGDTDGAILYGNLTDTSGVHGSGIRFSKSASKNVVYATNRDGDIGTGDFYGNRLYGDWATKSTNVYAMVDNGELRVTNLKGYNNGNPVYNDLRAREIKTTHSYAFSNHSGSDVYFGVGYNELRVTANNFYNGGKPQYQDIRFKNWTAMSHEKYKYDINEWDYDVLDVFKNELQLYSYKVESESNTEYARIHHGIVLRENSNLDRFPVEWRNGDGFDGNEIMFWNTKAIKEIIQKIDEQNKKIEQLEGYVNEQTAS